MDMNFENLKKIPPEPAARMLAMANMKLESQVNSPPSAPVDVVLQELADMEAIFDVLLLLAVALPPREAVWWACLAARDVVGSAAQKLPLPLTTSEAWVFKPNDENRIAARNAMEAADMDDDTVYCAMAVTYCDGTMGPGEQAEFPAPPNGVAAAVVNMNMLSLAATVDAMETHAEMLIERALDIARGGNGRVEQTDTPMPVEEGAP